MKKILEKILEALADSAPCSGVDAVKIAEARELVAELVEPAAAPIVTAPAEVTPPTP